MATNYYKTRNPKTGVDDFKEVGTDRYIGPNEYGEGTGFEERPAAQKPQVEASAQARYSPLGDYKSKQNLMDAIKAGIQKKQGLNKDIQSGRDYWRTQQRDPMTFTDQKLRLLSPAQQQQLREKRYATASAHLSGIREEEDYRGTRMEDIIGEVRGAQSDELAARREEQLAEGRRLDNIGKRESLGIKPTAEDLYGSFVSEDGQRVGDKQGGSLTWRNNNPGAIKFDYENGNMSGLAKDLQEAGINVKQGSPMQDGGHAISFASEEDGWKAAEMLLSGDYGYQNLTLEAAMRRWSNKGYGSEGMGIGSNTRMSEVTKYPELMEQVMEQMQKNEQWKEGTMLQQEEEAVKHASWSPANARVLSAKTGISSTELLANYSDAELDSLDREYSENITENLVKKFTPRDRANIKVTKINDLKEILYMMYELEAEDSAVEAAIGAFGLKNPADILTGIKSVVEPTTK